MEKLTQSEVMEIVEVSETVKEIPNFSRYLCDIKKGMIWRKPTEKSQGKWLNPKANDIGYKMTSIINDEGKIEHVYLHEIVMSAAIEFPKIWWKTKNLEIDHRDRVKWHNNFSNLQLVTKSKNHENIEGRKPHRRLTKDEVEYIRDDYKLWSGKKIPFYKEKSDELGCVWQTIQYLILGYNYNVKKD